MLQFIRSVNVEYVVRISSVTTLYIVHWNVFVYIRHADRQTDRQTDRTICNYRNRDSILQTENMETNTVCDMICWWYAGTV